MKLTTMSQITLDGVSQGNGEATDQERREGFERGGWARGAGDDETRAFIAQTYLGTASLLSISVVSAAPANAENNGVGAKPALGWSSWSFVRSHPTAAVIDAQADAMRSNGLAAVGYDYVNVDDF